MLKHIIAILLLSILIVLTMPYAQIGLQAMVSLHDMIAEALTLVFSGGQAGNITRKLIALLSVPLLAGLIPACIYYLVKRSWFPYFIEFVWVTWLVQTAAIVILYQSNAA